MSDSAEALSGKVGTGFPAESATKLSRTRLARVAERLILFTDDERLPDPLAAAKALPRGSLVIVRSRDPERRRQLVQNLRAVARAKGLVVLVAGDVVLGRACGGVHLPEARIGAAAGLRARRCGLITAAAHSPAAWRKAGCVDGLILSAVFPTASHPGRAALGPVRASLIARQSPKPVFALGGITAQNAARLSGFDGIACIGALAV